MLEYLPPRTERLITIDGYAVPMLEAFETDNGTKTNICLDHRFGITIPADIAQEVLWLLANAVAIGAGYSCHGENSRIANPFKVQVCEVGFVEKGPTP